MHIQNFWYAEFLTPSVFIYHPSSSPCFPCLSRFPPSNHLLIFASLTIFSWSYDTVFPPPPLNLHQSPLPHLSGFLTVSPFWHTNTRAWAWWRGVQGQPQLEYFKREQSSTWPYHLFPPLILHFTLSGFLSQGPRWLLFPLSLMGIRDPSLLEVLISVAVLLSTDFESIHLQSW